MSTKVYQNGNLDITYDAESGQLLRVHDRELDMTVISFRPGVELTLNHLPINLALTSVDENQPDPAFQCKLTADWVPAMGCTQSLDVMRQVIVGSACKPWGNHINPPNSLHLRYRLDRRQNTRFPGPVPAAAGQRPIEPPLWLDTVGTLGARTDWFGPQTRMLAAHFGGCGPREHVGFDDDLVAAVTPYLQNHYRRTHPGVQWIPGAVYYHPDGRWLWVTCQRPTVGMHWDFANDGQTAQFQYHKLLDPSEIVHTPEVSLYWGRGGKPELFARLNASFIGYEEPGDWFFHKSWFWFHWWQYRERGLDEMADNAKFLHDELGIEGFGLTTHDVRPGGWDCGPTGLRPSPHWGGDAGLRRFGKTVRQLGGKCYVWLPFLGLSQPSLDLKADWTIKGVDGRAFESFYIGAYDMYHAVNYNHPEVQEYYLNWIRRYITEYYVEGIFWDCGGTPLPPDFSPAATRPFQQYPSESMVSGMKFLERVMQVGRECSPDFFMWLECGGTDWPATGFSTGCAHGDFLFNLNRYGRKRLVYRGGGTYNLVGGFATPKPGSDTAFKSPVTNATYRAMASDPMNKWVVSFVRQHGCHDAIGVAPGVTLCAGHLVVDPAKERREIIVPPWAAKPKKLTNVLTGKTVKPTRITKDGAAFRLEPDSAWALE